jgi:hypothetical protein
MIEGILFILLVIIIYYFIQILKGEIRIIPKKRDGKNSGDTCSTSSNGLDLESFDGDIGGD